MNNNSLSLRLDYATILSTIGDRRVKLGTDVATFMSILAVMIRETPRYVRFEGCPRVLFTSSHARGLSILHSPGRLTHPEFSCLRRGSYAHLTAMGFSIFMQIISMRYSTWAVGYTFPHISVRSDGKTIGSGKNVKVLYSMYEHTHKFHVSIDFNNVTRSSERAGTAFARLRSNIIGASLNAKVAPAQLNRKRYEVNDALDMFIVLAHIIIRLLSQHQH